MTRSPPAGARLARHLPLLLLVPLLALSACTPPGGGSSQIAVTLSSAGLTVEQGIVTTVTVTVEAQDGGGSVTLAVSGDLAGLDVGFDPATVTPAGGAGTATSTLTLEVAAAAQLGERALEIRAEGAGGAAGADFALSIAAAGSSGAGPESYKPGVTGELRTAELNGEDFTYEVIDGLAIVQGDMILGDVASVEDDLAMAALGSSTATCNFDFGFGCGRWENGVIGYAFADDWGSQNATMRSRILSAIAHWEDNTSLRFVERGSGDRIVFKNSSGCSSDIGRVEITGFDPQSVRLSTGCGFGTVVHEIGHAVGLWHEQARLDRDSWVTVDFGDVQDFKLHNYFTHVGLGVDVGAYDYDSIMHYGKDDFARDADGCNAGDLTQCPILPLGGVDPNRIGQRTGLSDGDVLGAYWLYPPEFTIAGAAEGASDDRFALNLDWGSEPVRSDFIRWSSDRVSGDLGTGSTLELVAAELPSGSHTITARVRIFGVTVRQDTLTVTLQNSAPSVDLGSDRDVDLNRVAFVSASVSDSEDGACAPSVCSYDWDPVFDEAGGGTVGYLFTTAGARTVSVTVTDNGGATDSDSVVLTVVNTPPSPDIAVPSDGASFSLGGAGSAVIPLSGSAGDPNEGPGPGDGAVACSQLLWSSSVASDSFDDASSCDPVLTVTSAGPRTLTLTATDSQGASAATSVAVTVAACSGNCDPEGSFVFTTPEDFDDASFDNPGYWISTAIGVTATIRDPDVPADNPIGYRWTADPPCLAPGGCGDDEILLAQGSVSDPAGAAAATVNLSWTPEDDITPWSNCSNPGAYLPYRLRLVVTDDLGGSSTFTSDVTLGCVLF